MKKRITFCQCSDTSEIRTRALSDWISFEKPDSSALDHSAIVPVSLAFVQLINDYSSKEGSGLGTFETWKPGIS